MTTTWPIDLPKTALVANYGEMIQDGRTLSKATLGLGRRRAFQMGIRKTTIQMNMTTAQWERLQTFWNEEISHGVDAFYMPDSIQTGKSLMVKNADGSIDDLVTDGGDAITVMSSILVQFGQEPPSIQETNTQDLFVVQMALEILP